MKETTEPGFQVDKLALDVHREPVVIHVLGHREGDRQGPRTMYKLDKDLVEIQNYELPLYRYGRDGQNHVSGYTVLHAMRRRARVSCDTMFRALWRRASGTATLC